MKLRETVILQTEVKQKFKSHQVRNKHSTYCLHEMQCNGIPEFPKLFDLDLNTEARKVVRCSTCWKSLAKQAHQVPGQDETTTHTRQAHLGSSKFTSRPESAGQGREMKQHIKLSEKDCRQLILGGHPVVHGRF